MYTKQNYDLNWLASVFLKHRMCLICGEMRAHAKERSQIHPGTLFQNFLKAASLEIV